MLNANEIHSDDTRINVLPDGSLRIDEVSTTDAGHYECMAKNNMGEVHSRQAQMVVNNEVIETEAEAPKFIQTPPVELDLAEGQPLVLHCVVSGAPTPSILWKFNNQNIQNGRIKLFGNGSLILPVASLDDGGVYSCYAGNAIGNASVNATVHVNEISRSTTTATATMPPASASASSQQTIVIASSHHGDDAITTTPTTVPDRTSTTVAGPGKGECFPPYPL
ncbi:hypothetical protein RP20_CCG021186 [Aedes albopictus]|nr:hypothetical protein RP20_CCG021186 [Aedes albopictus]